MNTGAFAHQNRSDCSNTDKVEKEIKKCLPCKEENYSEGFGSKASIAGIYHINYGTRL